MAIKPDSSTKQFIANKLFTGRERERSIFRNRLKERQPAQRYNVLHWYGVGGQGKSALSHEFMRIYSSERTLENNHPLGRRYAAGRIEFEAARMRQIDQALLSLRLQLHKAGGISFPSFDLAFARYITMMNPGVEIRKLHPELFRGESDLLDDLVELVEGGVAEFATDAVGAIVPGLNVLLKYTQRLSNRTREWIERRGQVELAGIDQLNADQLLAKLPSYFGWDVTNALNKRPELRALIILDGYEALWRDSPKANNTVTGHRMDAWVRDLVKNCPGALFAIFGRDELGWGLVDPDWSEHIEAHLLDELLDDDADEFLSAVPISDPKIRDRIIEGAKGLPFYLDLQVDLYVGLQNAGETPQVDQFGSSHPDILARFLDHIGEAEENILRLASYPSTLSETVMIELADRFLGGAGHVDWSKLITRSFIRPEDKGEFTMHQLMRDLMQSREKTARPEVYRRIHEFLFSKLKEQIPDQLGNIGAVHDLIFEKCCKHLAAYDEDSKWSLEKVEIFQRAGRHAVARDFWHHRYVSANAELGPEHLDTLSFRRNFAAQLSRLGDDLAARDEFQAIYNIQSQHDELGMEHTVTLETRAWLALENGELGEHHLARDEFQTVYDILRRPDRLGPKHPDVLTVRHNIAQQRGYLGEHQFARDEYQAIYDILCKHNERGPEHPDTLMTRSNLAHATSELGDDRLARDEYRAIYDIQRRPDVLGPLHPATLNTRHTLAALLSDLGEDRAALEEIRALYEIERQDDMFGPEHPRTLATRSLLASVLGSLGDHRAARDEYQDIYNIQSQSEELGPEHHSTLATRARLAQEHGFLGDHRAALEELQAIYNIECRLEELGTEHPRTLNTRESIAFQMGDLGDHIGARDEFQAIYDIRRRSEKFGPEHYSTLWARHHLAVQLGGLSEHAAARDEFQAVYDIERRPDKLGPEHPSTLSARYNLALRLSYLGERAAAREEFRAIYDIRRRPDRLGPDHLNTLTVRANLARMNAYFGDVDHAIDEMDVILAKLQKTDIYGMGNHSLFVVRNYQIEVLGLAGQFERAYPLAIRLDADMSENLLETHFLIIKTREWLQEHCSE